ncbi:unnamed protein product [Moneuplotes crassus]|uniref:Uncharacterized protein n=1 Tax=Euplotes crassus TaxID=5936 RepID=A0AAD1UKM5_EUPCR|nr:unnamed protein product [Moneuplotes crassus]
MHLQQQSSSALVVRNIEISEVSSMGVTIESYDTNSVHNFTLVEIHNMTVFNVDGDLRSVLNINKGAIVSIMNSTFFNTSNIGNGPVIAAGKKNALVEVYDSEFYNNTSVEGGVMVTESGSTIKCYRCHFKNNFAVNSGIIKIESDGIFEFYDSEFYDNIAATSPIATIFSSQFESVFNNCTFSRNLSLLKTKILSEVVPNVIRTQNLKDYIEQNHYLLDTNSFPSCIRVQFGSLKMENGVRSIDQNTLIKSEVGIVRIKNLIVEQTSSVSNIIAVSESELYVSSMTLNLLTSREDSAVIYATTSIATFENITFTDSNIRLLRSVLCTININGLISKNITEETRNIVDIIRARKETKNQENAKISSFISNVEISNITNNQSEIIEIYQSELVEFSNVRISNCLHNIVSIKETKIDLMSGWNMTNNERNLRLYNSDISQFTDSNFINCGSQDVLEGGAILIDSSKVSISGAIFSNNNAKSGGAISILCSMDYPCLVTLQNSTFTGNVASLKGGAIYYNWNRPIMENILCEDNSAFYGQNIGSYPIKIVQRGTKNNKILLRDVGTGIEYDKNLEFDLVDYDKQVTNLENSAIIKIAPIEKNSSIRGNDFGSVRNGSASIDKVIFQSYFGKHTVPYSLISKAIDSEIIESAFTDTQEEYDNIINVEFRYCKPGEIQSTDNQCQQCSYGTYTLNWNETECHSCMDHATCTGRDAIEVDQGYWKKSVNTSNIIKCVNPDACDGGYDPQSEHPVKCTTGYKGYLCSSCDILDGVKYEPVGNFQCSKCPNAIVNTIRVIVFSILVMVFLGALTFINMKKKKDNQMSILLRIFTNYLQLMSAAMAYNTGIPGSFKGLFSQFNKISLQTSFISYDCFIEDNEIRFFAPSSSLFKLFLYLCLPVVLVLAISCCIVVTRIILKVIRLKTSFGLSRAIIVSAICIIFLLHPKLTMEALSAFRCTQVDTNDYRMTLHMEYKCYSKEHISWLAMLGIPILTVYVLALPVVSFIILAKHKHKLSDWGFQKYFFILYQGLKPERYYWEFVNTLRKFGILAINSLMISVSINYKLLLSVAVMIALLRIQNTLKPYKNTENNQIELLAIMSGSITIFSCIIFSQNEERYPGFHLMATILIFMINSYFLVQFTYLIICAIDSSNEYYKCIIKVLSKLLCKKYTEPNKVPESCLLRDDDHNIKSQIIIRKAKGHKKSKKFSKIKSSRSKFRKVKKLPMNKPAREADQLNDGQIETNRLTTNFGLRKSKRIFTKRSKQARRIIRKNHASRIESSNGKTWSNLCNHTVIRLCTINKRFARRECRFILHVLADCPYYFIFVHLSQLGFTAFLH